MKDWQYIHLYFLLGFCWLPAAVTPLQHYYISFYIWSPLLSADCCLLLLPFSTHNPSLLNFCGYCVHPPCSLIPFYGDWWGIYLCYAMVGSPGIHSHFTRRWDSFTFTESFLPKIVWKSMKFLFISKCQPSDRLVRVDLIMSAVCNIQAGALWLINEWMKILQFNAFLYS